MVTLQSFENSCSHYNDQSQNDYGEEANHIAVKHVVVIHAGFQTGRHSKVFFCKSCIAMFKICKANAYSELFRHAFASHRGDTSTCVGCKFLLEALGKGEV